MICWRPAIAWPRQNSGEKQQETEARHKQEMEALAGRETATWTEVERLPETYQSNAYDSAVALLT